MKKRLLTPNPLEGAAPRLQPTARPVAIDGGATPAPRRSPLAELAQSFDGFNDNLKGILQDTAVREERDAGLLGEQMAAEDARRQASGARMAEIETQLKDAVDAGQVSRVRLPAFERAYRMRTGQERAVTIFQDELRGTLKDASRLGEDRIDPNKALADAYGKALQGIGEHDLYARAGFERAAEEISQKYRARVAETYAANKLADAETKAADEGADLLYRLGTAAGDDEEVNALFALNDHFGRLRKEFPKHEVNQFFAKGALASAVQDLVSQGKIHEAERIVTHMEQLDLTGEGGLFARTEAGGKALAQLRNTVEQGYSTRPHRELGEFKAAEELQAANGKSDAVKLLAQLEQAGQLQGTRDLQSYVQKYGKDWGGDNNATRYNAFVEVLNEKFDERKKACHDPQAVAEVLKTIPTISPDDIDTYRAKAKSLVESGRSTAGEDLQIDNALREQEALFQKFTKADLDYLHKSVFVVRQDAGSLTDINFGEPTSSEQTALGIDPKTKKPRDLSSAWSGLSEDRRNEIEVAVTKTFRDAVISQMRRGDPKTLDTDKLTAYLPEALKQAREAARKMTLGAAGLAQKAKEVAAVEEHQKAVAKAAALAPVPVQPSNDLFDPRVVTKKVVTRPLTGTAEEEVKKEIEGVGGMDFRRPSNAEADEVAVPMWISHWQNSEGKQPRTVNLPTVAGLIASPDSPPEKRAKASQLYGIAKALLGFTPEEITAGVTKHGVPFRAEEIDAERVPVFRDLAELKKNRTEDGKYTPEFLDILNRVEPGMTPEKFYTAQLAVLSARSKR